MRALIVVLALSQSLAAQPPARTAIDRALPRFNALQLSLSPTGPAFPVITTRFQF